MLQNFNFAKKIPENMLRNLIGFSVLLIIAISCTKTKDVVDYGPIDKKIIEEYILANHDTTAQSTASGLYYIIQNPGEDIHPSLNSVVTVNYQGYLTNGTLFDSSAAGEPLKIALNRLIDGWQEGLQLIGTGGKITLIVPSKLGYGAYAIGSIPANSVLIFNIELIKIE
jgi:FKBP-type peptidyl-prolyl cis-trans isomerase FkpA